MIEVRFTINDTTDEPCACDAPCPFHVGVHPQSCRRCKGVIE